MHVMTKVSAGGTSKPPTGDHFSRDHTSSIGRASIRLVVNAKVVAARVYLRKGLAGAAARKLAEAAKAAKGTSEEAWTEARITEALEPCKELSR